MPILEKVNFCAPGWMKSKLRRLFDMVFQEATRLYGGEKRDALPLLPHGQ